MPQEEGSLNLGKLVVWFLFFTESLWICLWWGRENSQLDHQPTVYNTPCHFWTAHFNQDFDKLQCFERLTDMQNQNCEASLKKWGVWGLDVYLVKMKTYWRKDPSSKNRCHVPRFSTQKQNDQIETSHGKFGLSAILKINPNNLFLKEIDS